MSTAQTPLPFDNDRVLMDQLLDIIEKNKDEKGTLMTEAFPLTPAAASTRAGLLLSCLLMMMSTGV